MSERTRSTLFATAIGVMAFALVALVATSPTDEDRVARVGASIMCPVCQGESILGSPAPMARDMMALVEERVAQGASDTEVVDELLSSYSGAILLDPPVGGPTVVLWLAPVLALVAGVAVIVWWRRHPGQESPQETPASVAGRGRRAAGALLLLATFSGLVVAVGFFLQDRDGPGGGVADLTIDSLDDVSNDTMEAVIAANPTTPGVNGMRLALADRYFGEGQYRSAFPHYLAVAESVDSNDQQVVAALLALGWMTWDGNRQAETAIGLFDQALAIEPQSVPARYMKSQVLWCGGVSVSEAENLLHSIADDPSTPAEWVTLAHSDLEAVRDGDQCA